MVQFFKGSEDPRDRAVGLLGEALGMGLGNGINTYFANRSLDSVLQDKALKDAPLSEKFSKLQSAMQPYGEKGQELLQQRLQIEQQAMQEEQQNVLGQVAAGKEVSDKDFAKLTPENQFKVMQIQKNRTVGQGIYNALIKAGYPEQTAKLWQIQMENAPVGGQSDVIRQVNDLIRRTPQGKGVNGEVETKPEIKFAITTEFIGP
jgi:hypothetical protein